jgi:hypothetical protein
MTSGTVEQQKIERLKNIELDLEKLASRSYYNDDTVDINRMLVQARKERLKWELKDALRPSGI